MTRTITALADRLVGTLAPRTTASATCYEISCFCSGVYLYKKQCCDLKPCGPCNIVYRGGC